MYILHSCSIPHTELLLQYFVFVTSMRFENLQCGSHRTYFIFMRKYTFRIYQMYNVVRDLCNRFNLNDKSIKIKVSFFRWTFVIWHIKYICQFDLLFGSVWNELFFKFHNRKQYRIQIGIWQTQFGLLSEIRNKPFISKEGNVNKMSNQRKVWTLNELCFCRYIYF